MHRPTVKFKKLREQAVVPAKATPGSAAADLRACIDAPITIPPRGRAPVPTGLAIELPGEEYVALVFARSGNAMKYGITLANSVGVIDSDYRGELITTLINCSDEPFVVNSGDRIAQLMITYAIGYDTAVCGELSDTARGEGGFGSTGTR